MAEQWSFIGPLTMSQALILDKPEVMDSLKQFRPERCLDCWQHLEMSVIGGIATRVVLNELTILDAAKEVVDYTAGCSGGEVDQTRFDAPIICPKQEEEKRMGRTSCW